jgi:hypothetical protein
MLTSGIVPFNQEEVENQFTVVVELMLPYDLSTGKTFTRPENGLSVILLCPLEPKFHLPSFGKRKSLRINGKFFVIL